MEYDFLKQTILSTDLTELLPEHAELLLNYIATDEEQTALEKHSQHKSKLDEAERFMLEMTTVDRYESRLRVMAYIGCKELDGTPFMSFTPFTRSPRLLPARVGPDTTFRTL